MSKKPWTHLRNEFIKISNRFLQTTEFTCHEKVVLLYLLSLPSNCRPSYHSIRRATGISRPTIAKVLRGLIADQVIAEHTYRPRPTADWRMVDREDSAYRLGRDVDAAVARDNTRRLRHLESIVGPSPRSEEAIGE